VRSTLETADVAPETPVATRAEEASLPIPNQITLEEQLAHLAVRRLYETVRAGNAPLLKRITLRKTKTEKGTPMIIASGVVPTTYIACANPEEV